MPKLNRNSMLLERDGIDLTAHFTSVRSFQEFEYRSPRPMGFSPDQINQPRSIGYEIELGLIIVKNRISQYTKYLMANSTRHTVFVYNSKRVEGQFEILWFTESGVAFNEFWGLEFAMRSVFRT